MLSKVPAKESYLDDFDRVLEGELTLADLEAEEDEKLKKKDKYDELVDDFNDMVEEFNTKMSTYQSKGSTWTQAVRESKEKELTEIQQRIQEFQQTVQVELQQQQEQLMQPIYQKVNEVVQDLAKKGGYIYVFDTGAVLYVDPAQSHDLTPEARKALNIPADRTLEALAAELQAQQQAAQQ